MRYKGAAMSEQRITADDVRKVARLARLAMDENRLGAFAAQLEGILHYVGQIQKLDVGGVEPMAHVLPLKNVLREDIAGPALPLEKVLANAPETDGPFFKVPKIIGGEVDSG